MTPAEIERVLSSHKKWLNKKVGGSCADLLGAHLSFAEMRFTDLRQADMRGADMRSADMRSADLRSADMRSADLRDADLIGADLIGADLIGADLKDANLIGADLKGAKGIHELDMVDPRGYHPLAIEQKDGIRIFSGCRWLTVPEAIERWGVSSHHNHPHIAKRYVRAINQLMEELETNQ